jgi:hypothetical protein
MCSNITLMQPCHVSISFPEGKVQTGSLDELQIGLWVAGLIACPTGLVLCGMQMLGRGLRIMPGKRECMVLDFTDKYHQVSGSRRQAADNRLICLAAAKPACDQDQASRAPFLP